MKIVEQEGCFDHIEHIGLGDLELIVAAANIAGHMEKADKICIDSDTALAEAVIDLLTEYNLANNDSIVFPEFAEEYLLNRFYVDQTEDL